MIFYLAKALRRANRFDAAIKEYEHYLELEKDFRPGRHAAAYGIAVCHLLNRDWRRAVRAGKIAVAIEPRLAESRCLIADAYLALSYYGLAMRWYKSALNCKAPPPDYPHFVDRSFYSTYPLQQLKLFKVVKIEE
jgi:tetratricopeptide (TPR) repeat protein